MCIRCVHVERGCLHLHGHDPHARPALIHICTGIVEDIRREDVSDLDIDPELLCRIHRLLEEAVICDRGEGTRNLELLSIVRIRAGTHADDDILQIYLRLDGTGGTDTDDVIDVIGMEQLVRIDTDGRHTHAAAHDRNLLAVIGSGVTQHVTNGVEADRILEVGFCDILRAERIARHQNGFRDIAKCCFVVRCRHSDSPFDYVKILLIRFLIDQIFYLIKFFN